MKDNVMLFEAYAKRGTLKPAPDKLLDFPELRQTYDYDCGASALQGVLAYYGKEFREEQLLKQLDTVRTTMREHGTRLSRMKSVAERHGLRAEVRGMLTVDAVKKYIDQGVPPILLLQAWMDKPNKGGWPKDYRDGHYAVAIGYDEKRIYFEDPSSFKRVWLSYAELEKRWHDLADDNKTPVEHVAVIVKGRPRFRSDKAIHMD